MPSALDPFVGQRCSIQRFEDSWVVTFIDAELRILNPVEAVPSLELAACVEVELRRVSEDDDAVEMLFAPDRKIRVDLREAAFTGPEAMVLQTATRFVVWQ